MHSQIETAFLPTGLSAMMAYKLSGLRASTKANQQSLFYALFNEFMSEH